MEAIKQYVNLQQHPTMIVNLRGELLFLNKATDKICHGALSVYDIFCEKSELIISKLLMVKEKKQQIKFEINLFCNSLVSFMAEITPIGDENYIIQLIPAMAFKKLEDLIFNNISRFPSDSRWVLDMNFKTISFTADPDSFFYGQDPGFDILDAVESNNDKSDVLEGLRRAKAQEGVTHKIKVEVKRKHGLAKIEASIQYLTDTFFGSRYLIVSRPIITNRAKDILDRTSEVVGADSDERLAEYLGITPGRLNKLRKRDDLPAELKCRIIEDFKITYWWLVHGLGKQKFVEE
ncbi:hypothetical protein [Maridesulfovibrio bastinii]|uniref:hypothetical protein n=1 Tax=Maridesulfovibrio bastinii TaxID=47157 RepID=UPI000408FFB8|nr:hypothetical protein [Maridesulfovibrio bastinii]